jgi:hypothetical protein
VSDDSANAPPFTSNNRVLPPPLSVAAVELEIETVPLMVSCDENVTSFVTTMSAPSTFAEDSAAKLVTHSVTDTLIATMSIIIIVDLNMSGIRRRV